MFLGKEVRVFLKGQGKEAYLELKKRDDQESKAILNSFDRIKNVLKDNPQYGDPISKYKIPKNMKQLGIKNLYRVELSNYWRAIIQLKEQEWKYFYSF